MIALIDIATIIEYKNTQAIVSYKNIDSNSGHHNEELGDSGTPDINCPLQQMNGFKSCMHLKKRKKKHATR